MTMRVKPYIAACAGAVALAWALWGATAPSPVADAAEKGDIATVRALLAKKTDINAPQADGATALQWAAYADNPELAEVLIKGGAPM